METDTDIDSAVAIWTPSSLLLALGPLTAVVTVLVLLRLSPSGSTRVGSSGGLRGVLLPRRLQVSLAGGSSGGL